MLARVTEPVAYQAFQHFITHAPWDADRVWRRLRAVLPERRGIFILDGTSFPETGDRVGWGGAAVLQRASTNERVASFGNAQLRRAHARLSLLRSKADITPDVAASSDSFGSLLSTRTNVRAVRAPTPGIDRIAFVAGYSRPAFSVTKWPAQASFWFYEGLGDGLVIDGRRALPFVERDGQNWGSPLNDLVAIDELEWRRASGADFLVFMWLAFWWLDHYSGLHRYLR